MPAPAFAAAAFRSRRYLAPVGGPSCLCSAAGGSEEATASAPPREEVELNHKLATGDYGELLALLEPGLEAAAAEGAAAADDDDASSGSMLLSPVNVSTALVRLARANAGGLEELRRDAKAHRAAQALAEQVASRAPSFGDWALASAARSLVLLGCAGPGVMEAVWEEAARRLRADEAAFGPQALETIAWAWTKAGAGGPGSPLMALAAADVASRAAEFEPRGLANMVWALSRAPLGCIEAPARAAAMDAIAEQVAARPQQFRGGEISTILASFARAGHRAPQMFSAVGGALKAQAAQLKPQELANALWAYAKASGHHSKVPRGLLEALAGQVAKKAAVFSASEVAIAAWGLASLRFEAPRAFAALADRGEPLAAGMPAREAAMTAWAFGRAGHAAPGLLSRIASSLVASITGGTALSAGELCMALQGFADAGVQSRRLFSAAGGALRLRAEEMSTQEQAVAIRACAKARRSPDGLFDALAFGLAANYASARPQEVAMAAWGLAKASHPAPELFDEMAESLTADAAAFKPRELCNVLWALVKMHPEAATAACEEAEAELERRQAEFKPRDRKMLGDAFKAAGRPVPALCAPPEKAGKQRRSGSRGKRSAAGRGRAR